LRLPGFWGAINRPLVESWRVAPAVEGIAPAKPRIDLRSDRKAVVMPLAFRQKSGALLQHSLVCSGVRNKSPVICQLAMKRFTRRFMQTRRWAVIYGAPCVARNKSVSAMPVAMIDEGKSLIDARLLSAPNRLSDALMSVTGKAIPSLGRRTNTPSSLWLREKAATQWWPKFIERLPSKSVLPLSSDLHRSLRGPRRSLSIMVRSLRAIS